MARTEATDDDPKGTGNQKEDSDSEEDAAGSDDEQEDGSSSRHVVSPGSIQIWDATLKRLLKVTKQLVPLLLEAGVYWNDGVGGRVEPKVGDLVFIHVCLADTTSYGQKDNLDYAGRWMGQRMSDWGTAYYRRFAALYKTAQEVPGAIDREGVSGVPDEDLKDFEEWWKKAGAECKDAQEDLPIPSRPESKQKGALELLDGYYREDETMNPRSDKYAPKFSDKTWLQRALSDKALNDLLVNSAKLRKGKTSLPFGAFAPNLKLRSVLDNIKGVDTSKSSGKAASTSKSANKPAEEEGLEAPGTPGSSTQLQRSRETGKKDDASDAEDSEPESEDDPPLAKSGSKKRPPKSASQKDSAPAPKKHKS